MPYLTPDSPLGENQWVYTIPDTIKPLFIGALCDLIELNHWEQFGTLTPEQTIALVEAVLASEARAETLTGQAFEWETSPVTAGPDQNRSTGTTTYTRLTADIWVEKPIKITAVAWDIRVAGAYKLGVTAGPYANYVDTWVQSYVLAQGPQTVNFSFSASPKILLPGRYWVALEKTDGGAGYYDYNSPYVSNELYYSDGCWYGSTFYDQYTAPIRITAYPGVVIP